MKMTTMMTMALAVLFTAGAAMAQIQATIITPEGRRIEGTIRWTPGEKKYAVTQKGKNVEMAMEAANIKDIEVARPNELVAAIDKIRQGDAATAIPMLEKVAKDYLMLKWDKVATRYLAEANLKDGNFDKAIAVCETIIRSDPKAAYLGDMAPCYWQALMKKGRTSTVEELLGQAIKSGDRTASAFAQIMRGDVILAGGETPENAKKALRDGYLRVVTLYKAVRDAQPEALYKAAKCFDKLGQTSRADQMRTQLKGEFAASAWAKK
ncbi:MAG: tetratricopeptide repeat protein [Kiritimatiellae bacterium]|nr:tetratricopeptide repeat protein [Kiritimatiellia bacterium]